VPSCQACSIVVIIELRIVSIQPAGEEITSVKAGADPALSVGPSPRCATHAPARAQSLEAGRMDEWVRAHVQQHVALLRKELSAVEQRIWSHIKGHAELKTVWRRLQTIRGSGPIAAAYLLAEVGHIKRFADPRALVSLAGLAIKRCDSGRTVHARPMIDRHGRTKQADESRAVSGDSQTVTYRLWRLET
jgi:transposase